MELKEVKGKLDEIVAGIKDHGLYPKENSFVDYKAELVINDSGNPTEAFLWNFAKDVIAFANSDGGVMLIGFKENSLTGIHEDSGLDEENLTLLRKVDLNYVSQKFEKITKIGISLDLQSFQISTRKFYSLQIAKAIDVLVPINDFVSYRIKKGEIYYRDSGKNTIANKSTSELNKFIQIKANEKSKEFMQIWSSLLPEMVDINPKEVLILNPNQNKVYGFNSKDKTLSGSSIDIEKSREGVFNIILNAISAGEIGKITDNEGKPIYKLVGEIHRHREHISLSSLEKAVKEIVNFKFTNVQLKKVIHHLNWTFNERFEVVNPDPEVVNKDFNKFIWIETVDEYSGRSKIFFSPNAIEDIKNVIDNESLHIDLFDKVLRKK